MKCFSDIRQIICSLILISHYNHLVLTGCAEKYLTKQQQQDNLELCLQVRAQILSQFTKSKAYIYTELASPKALYS